MGTKTIKGSVYIAGDLVEIDNDILCNGNVYDANGEEITGGGLKLYKHYIFDGDQYDFYFISNDPTPCNYVQGETWDQYLTKLHNAMLIPYSGKSSTSPLLYSYRGPYLGYILFDGVNGTMSPYTYDDLAYQDCTDTVTEL